MLPMKPTPKRHDAAGTILEKALSVALKAHAGQVDKVGQPYILHPLRVMLRTSGHEARVVALLHDVIEDSGGVVELRDLRRLGFADTVVTAVDALTHRPGETYAAYIRRAAANPLARTVKIADLEDNMTFRRIHRLLHKDRARMARYQRAYRYLTGRSYDINISQFSRAHRDKEGDCRDSLHCSAPPTFTLSFGASAT